MIKVIIYTHDAFGLGNIRRMLSISEHLNCSIKDISLLLISGSPMLQSFRLSKGIDYIKLPTISRSEKGEYQPRSVGTSLKEVGKIRSNIIMSVVRGFKPDFILVDKKPLGLNSELLPVLKYLRKKNKIPRMFLILRDILGEAKITHAYWDDKKYFDVVDSFYERILILGDNSVYDVGKEYRFPESCREKIHYCGYLKRDHSDLMSKDWVRQQIGIQQERFILVTVGGGGDGELILKTFLEFWQNHSLGENVHAVIVYGPEIKKTTINELINSAISYHQLTFLEFTPHLLSFMKEAEVVVCMAGYNTLSEVLSLNKKVVCIPRTKPVEEQLIRATRFAQLSLLEFIHPDELCSKSLSKVITQLMNVSSNGLASDTLKFSALQEVTKQLTRVSKEKKQMIVNLPLSKGAVMKQTNTHLHSGLCTTWMTSKNG